MVPGCHRNTAKSGNRAMWGKIGLRTATGNGLGRITTAGLGSTTRPGAGRLIITAAGSATAAMAGAGGRVPGAGYGCGVLLWLASSVLGWASAGWRLPRTRVSRHGGDDGTGLAETGTVTAGGFKTRHFAALQCSRDGIASPGHINDSAGRPRNNSALRRALTDICPSRRIAAVTDFLTERSYPSTTLAR
jgi:hypothetical protein